MLLYIILKVDELCQKDLQLTTKYPETTVLDEAKAAAKFAKNSEHQSALEVYHWVQKKPGGEFSI